MNEYVKSKSKRGTRPEVIRIIPRLHRFIRSCCASLSQSPDRDESEVGGTFVTAGHMSFHHTRSPSRSPPPRLLIPSTSMVVSFLTEKKKREKKSFVVNLSLPQSVRRVSHALGFFS